MNSVAAVFIDIPYIDTGSLCDWRLYDWVYILDVKRCRVEYHKKSGDHAI